MKVSTNFSFFIKILALAVLLLVGYSKSQIFSDYEIEDDEFSPVEDAGSANIDYDASLELADLQLAE